MSEGIQQKPSAFRSRGKFDQRGARTPVSHLGMVEALESRALLTSTGFEALNQGILGYDQVRGEWTALRYDGIEYVQDQLNDLNSIGKFGDPIKVDLDGDGRSELYFQDMRSGDWFSLKPEDSGDPYQWVCSWTATASITAVLTGDLNGDGRNEIVSFNSSGEWLSLSWNGTNYQTTFIQGWYAASSWVGHQFINLDGQGTEELAAFDAAVGRWYAISFGGGGYTTSFLADWNSTHEYGSLLKGDFDRNGSEELVARDETGSWWRLSWNGNGYQTDFMQGWDPDGNWREFSVVDLNGDGRQEIVGHQTSTGKWWGLFREGANYVSRELGYSDPTAVFSEMLVGDITGDGREDIVSRDNHGNFWALTSSGGNSQVQFIKNWTTNTTWSDLRLIDFDGDGVDELLGRNTGNGFWWAIDNVPAGYTNQFVAQWGTAGNYLFVFDGLFLEGNGVGLAAWDTYGDWWYSSLGASTANRHIAIVQPPVHYSRTYVADVNGDGNEDLIGYDSNLGNWWALVQDYGGKHARYLGHWDPSVPWENELLLDIDGDGRKDLAGYDPLSGNWWGITSEGRVSRSRKLTNWSTSNSYRNVMVIDLNGDGKQEIVGRNSVGTWWGVFHEEFGMETRYLQGWTESWNWENISAIDLEGDGRQEILGYSETKGEWWELYWNGSEFASRRIAAWDPSRTYGSPLIGDLNGDGLEDISARSNTGDWIFLAYNGSEYLTQFLTTWGVASPWKSISIADLDGDGKSEIVGQEVSTGTWWGIFANSTGAVSRALVSGSEQLNSESVRIADLNQDGHQELVGFDSARNSWWGLSLQDNSGHVDWLGELSGTFVEVGTLPGVSNTMLRRQILFEIPDLVTALANRETLRAAQLILGWTAKVGDFALDGTDLAQGFGSVADLYYNYLKPNNKGMSCGGYSAFYSGVLQLFGIDSVDIGFGELPELTHTTTVIPIFTDGFWKFHLLDATFGLNFRNPSNGDFSDWFELIDLYHVDRLSELLREEINLNGRDFLSQSPVVTKEAETLVLKGIMSGNYVYSYPGYGIDSYLRKYKEILIDYGYSADLNGFVALMLNRVYNVIPYGNSGSVAAAEFIRQLQSRGIPFGY